MAGMDAVLCELDLRSLSVVRSVAVRPPSGNVTLVLQRGVFL